MDKQDELAAAILNAVDADGDMVLYAGTFYTREATAAIIAAAVRSFMGSEDVVQRACMAAAKAGCAEYLWPDDFSPTEREADRKAMRAALSAAIGEDIGGGRG